MRLSGLFSFCLAALAAVGVHAQDAPDDPKGGTLVDCGPEKVAILARTESPDGQYALGWTVRPKPGRLPVDWAAYDRNEPGVFVAKYPVLDDDAVATYTLFDGVLDLRAGKFTPFASDWPYWPHKNHAGFGVAWSDDDHGTRYAIANNDSRFGTNNLWLVTIRAGEDVRVTDLALAAAKAVTKSLGAHTRLSDRYATTFFTSRSPDEDRPVPNPFKGKTLKLHFEAEIPKSIDGPVYEGEVTVSLPGGTIARVRSRVSS